MYSSILFYIAVVIIVCLVYRLQKLTLTGAVAGGLLTVILFLGFSFTAVSLMAAFFGMATWATSHGRKLKVHLKVEKEGESKRDVFQVLANGGIAGFIAFLVILFPEYAELLGIMIAGSFSAASADTLSSELGNVYGSRFVNILTLKKDVRGRDGVISLEGTFAGSLGSLIVALIFSVFTANYNVFFIIILAGLLGNLADSVLGATLERNHLIGNNMVNLLNTATGALCAGFLYQLV